MADNLKKRGGQDRQRINVTEDYELEDWSKKFGVSKDQLKEAVEAVGDRAEKVEKYLKGNERSGGEKGSNGRGRAGER